MSNEQRTTEPMTMSLADRLRLDYCSCSEGYTSRQLQDPSCESCSTKPEREEAAAEIERLQDLLDDREHKLFHIRHCKVTKLCPDCQGMFR